MGLPPWMHRLLLPPGFVSARKPCGWPLAVALTLAAPGRPFICLCRVFFPAPPLDTLSKKAE